MKQLKKLNNRAANAVGIKELKIFGSSRRGPWLKRIGRFSSARLLASRGVNPDGSSMSPAQRGESTSRRVLRPAGRSIPRWLGGI